MGYKSIRLQTKVLEMANKDYTGRAIAKKLKVSDARVSQIIVAERKRLDAERAKELGEPIMATPLPQKPRILTMPEIIPGEEEAATLEDLHDKLRDQLVGIEKQISKSDGRLKKEWVGIYGKLSDQLRRVCETRLVISDQLTRLKKYQEFEKIVLEELEHEGKEIATRVLERLQRRRLPIELPRKYGTSISGEGKVEAPNDNSVCGGIEPGGTDLLPEKPRVPESNSDGGPSSTGT